MNGSPMTTENQEEETEVFVDSFKMTNEDFNEYLVQSKLDPKLFKKYYKYLKQNGLNRSSGIKNILNIFFSKPIQQFIQKKND
jgi:ribosomal protein L19E